MSVKVGRAAIDTLTVQIERLEKLILKRVALSPQFRMLKTVTGIGPILAMTIALGWQRIRYYGFLGNRYRETKLGRCRELLHMNLRRRCAKNALRSETSDRLLSNESTTTKRT